MEPAVFLKFVAKTVNGFAHNLGEISVMLKDESRVWEFFILFRSDCQYLLRADLYTGKEMKDL